MASTFSISIDLSDVISSTNAITHEVFPRLHQSVGAIAQAAAVKWADAVMKAPGIWAVEKQKYVESIQWRWEGDFAAVVWTDYQVAEWIESGRPQRDLKTMLDTSSKVRRTEDGRRFLVIPFRHNTPGNDAHAKSMPPAVFALAGKMQKSRIASVGERMAGEITRLSPKSGMHPAQKQSPYLSNPTTKSDYMVAKRNYEWGDKVSKQALKQAGLSRQESRRYAGMVRMDTGTPGGAKSSAYMTFRVMVEDSKGWIVPAKPGMWIAKGIVEKLHPIAEKAFSEAIKLDIQS